MDGLVLRVEVFFRFNLWQCLLYAVLDMNVPGEPVRGFFVVLFLHTFRRVLMQTEASLT